MEERQITTTATTEVRCGRGHVSHSRALERIVHCHTALMAYGAERLDASGWRTLGVGSLPAASEGFRALALPSASGWATYEARDRWDQTIAQIAMRQPHWFDRDLCRRIETLGRSRLDLYEVEDDGRPETTLRRMRDGLLLRVDAFVDDGVVTPSGATLVARIARDDELNVLLDSAVLAPEAAQRAVAGQPPRDAEQWSRRLLDVLLQQFVAADLCGRDSVLQPQLLQHPLAAIGRLHRALKSLERSLQRRFAPLVRHHMLDGRTLTAERRGSRWRVHLDGDRPALVERVPRAASHPLDIEMMRQVGADERDGVLVMEGALDELATTCARVAVVRSSRAAA